MKYIAQPYYNNGPGAAAGNSIGVYSLPVNPGDMPVTTIQFSGPSGPNCVLLYQDSSSVFYLFVSFDFGTNGAVNAYQFSDITDLTNAALLPPPTQLTFPNSVAGLAVQPGTGDLYVATFSDGNGDGGVYRCPKGYTTSVQFSFYLVPQNNTPFYCANLAFDLHGNLWMSGFDNTPAAYLICFTQVPGDNTKFFLITNDGGQFSTVKTLPGSAPPPASLFPLSAPEGIAFDPVGNLWVGNNNDVSNNCAVNGAGNGTLLRISSAWIDTLLGNPETLGNNGFGGKQKFSPNDPEITVYYMKGALFGGLFFDGFTLYANDQGNGVVYECDSTAIETTFASSNIPTAYPGNGTMSIFNTTPPSLLIRDWAGDTGQEPDLGLLTGSVNAWESCDIGVSASPDLRGAPGPGGLPLSGPSLIETSTHALADSGITFQQGTPAYVYVKVANTGADSTGTEVLKLYWAKGSTGLDWPQPWDGSVQGTPALGGFIGAMLLPSIQKGYQRYVMMAWSTVPDPRLYPDTHFCLLARIETSSVYPFGMWKPEETGDTSTQTPLIDNVTNNSAIAWRNISIFTPPPPGIPPKGPHIPPKFKLGILGANYGSIAKKIGFAVQTLGRGGKPEPIKARVVVHAEGEALERLRESRFNENRVSYLGEGRFHVVDLEKGLEKIHLKPRETLPFTVEFTPEEDVHDFAVRVIQHVDVDGTRKVVGGQTFVVGKVEGFPVRKK